MELNFFFKNFNKIKNNFIYSEVAHVLHKFLGFIVLKKERNQMSSDCYEFEEEIVTSMNTLHVRISGANTQVENPLECVCVCVYVFVCLGQVCDIPKVPITHRII